MKKTEKVVFCVHNAAGIEICPPLANRVLAAHLQASAPEGTIETAVLDFDGAASADETLALVLKEDPDVVCLTCYAWNCQKAFALADAVKRERPETAVIAGGIQLNYDARDMAALKSAHKGIDVIVRREGELFLSEYFAQKKSARPKGGAVVEGKPAGRAAEYEKSLYQLFPPRSGAYDFLLINVDGPGKCYFNKCGFCLAPYYSSSFAPTTRSQMIKDVEWARDRFGKFYYNEPYINVNRKTLLDRARFLAEMGIAKSKRHEVYIRYDIFGEPDADALAELNACAGIGLQTIGEEAIRLSNRIFKKDRFEKALELLKSRGVDAAVDLMIGLPGETYDGFMAGYEYVSSLGARINANRLMVLPGSDFYYKRDALGLVYDARTCNIISTPAMTERELRKILSVTGAATVGEEGGSGEGANDRRYAETQNNPQTAAAKSFNKAAAREALLNARRFLASLPSVSSAAYKIETWGGDEVLIASFSYGAPEAGKRCRLAFLPAGCACDYAIEAGNFKLAILDRPPKRLAEEIERAAKSLRERPNPDKTA